MGAGAAKPMESAGISVVTLCPGSTGPECRVRTGRVVQAHAHEVALLTCEEKADGDDKQTRGKLHETSHGALCNNDHVSASST